MKMKKILVLLIGVFVLSLSLSAYGQGAKTTDIESVLDTPNAYIGKKIELAGYIKEKQFSDFKDWGFILSDKSGRAITCYEFETREVDFTVQEIVLRRAKKKNELVTVVGKLRNGPRLELETFETGGETYNTDKMIWDYE
jgi:hypothetical protein